MVWQLNETEKSSSTKREILEKFTKFWRGGGCKDDSPTQVKYKVGDVVRYRDFGLTCAVVAWDKVLRAPEEWVKLVNQYRIVYNACRFDLRRAAESKVTTREYE